MQQTNLDIEATIFIVSIIILILISFIGFVLVVYYYRRKKEREIQNLLQSQFSQTLLQSQLEIQEQTLLHISHELHDNLGQIASLIKINLNTIPLNDIPKAQQRIEDTKELTRQLITDLKALSVSLGGDRISQMGLARALEIEVERLNKTEEFKASFIQEGLLPVLSTDKATILYRMAQECINNMVKHSLAKKINVFLKTNENLVTLVLSDDGVGFNVDEQMQTIGAGLKNLQNRAKLINAELSIISTPGNGSTVNIQLIA
ncbi:MAG: sensor histidine kinase [Agriterribacter sp.]